MDYTIGYLPHPEGDYNQSNPYTPMAVVHLNGESFISKVNVPAGIIPRVSTDWTNYWQSFAAGTGGAQGATGAQGIQGPAGGGSGEPAQVRKPGLLVVQGNIKSATIIDEKHNDNVTVPIWYDTERKQHVVDVFNLEPALKSIGFTGAQGPQGIQGRDGAYAAQGIQGKTGAQGTQGIQGKTGAQGTQGYIGPTGTPSTNVETWTFTMEDDTVVTKQIYIQ